MKNYSVAVENQGEGITFLHTIVEGAVDDSYGIEVGEAWRVCLLQLFQERGKF